MTWRARSILCPLPAINACNKLHSAVQLILDDYWAVEGFWKPRTELGTMRGLPRQRTRRSGEGRRSECAAPHPFNTTLLSQHSSAKQAIPRVPCCILQQMRLGRGKCLAQRTHTKQIKRRPFCGLNEPGAIGSVDAFLCVPRVCLIAGEEGSSSSSSSSSGSR